jgi:hypothetical protein
MRTNPFIILGVAAITLVARPCPGQTWVSEIGNQPRVAVTPDGTVCVVYARDSVIYCSTSTDDGTTYAAPVAVGTVGQLMCGMRRGPQVAATAGSLVVTAIGKAGDIVCFRSSDHGKTWAAGGTVTDKEGAAREGLHAICAGAGEEVFAVWLDLRHGKTELTGALSRDGGRTWARNVPLYKSPSGRVCECCQPSVVSDGKGSFHVMWRNSLEGNRDMWMATFRVGNDFHPARKLGVGSWQLNACPMDGGGLAVDNQGRVVTVWRRGKDVFLCRPDMPETSMGEGSQPQVAATPDTVLTVWERNGEVFRQIPGSPNPILLGKGRFPSLALRPGKAGAFVIVCEADHGVRSYAVRIPPK